MTDFSPTLEQHAIVEAVKGPTSVMVNAFAGCAKTTTIVLAGANIKVPALALAFNKKIADELRPKFPPNFQVKTMNGLGFMVWGRVLDGARLTMDDKKLGKLVTQVCKDRKAGLGKDGWDKLRQLVSRAQHAGLVPAEFGHGLVPDTFEGWCEVGEALWLLPGEVEELWELGQEILQEDIRLAKQGVISFDDQVYCPTLLCPQGLAGGRAIWPKFPITVVDEAQDLSPLNHRMLDLATRTDGKLVAVGDPKQAIYSFRGADSSSMEHIKELRKDWVTLPLATTFRCPKRIVARQQGHAPGFRAWHTNREGMFGHWRYDDEFEDTGELAGWRWGDVESLAGGHETIAVLCRNNAPLLALGLKLLRQQVGMELVGRDIGKNLISLSKKIIPLSETPYDICKGKILEWKERESSKALANENDERVAGIVDRAECLLAVLDGGECRNGGELREVLGKLFAEASGRVQLSTIHRFKGGESDVVVHLDPWRVPSRQAKKRAAAGEPRELEQEWNLLYVCETRTKNVLVNANLEDFR